MSKPARLGSMREPKEMFRRGSGDLLVGDL